MQRAIPCALMRGGTSRGPLFLHSDLPSREKQGDLVDAILIRSLTPLVDSLAGGPSVTTKTAIISPSTHPHAHIDMHFAQIDASTRNIDWTPLCGNMLSAVGPFALERGIVAADAGMDHTDLVIRNVGTGALVDARVCTPNGQVTYEGDCEISGVSGTAAPIELRFREIAGAKTGAILPSGSAIDKIYGVHVSCVDVATPIMFVRARDMGKTAREPADQLTADEQFMTRLLKMRDVARGLMGLPDAPRSVLPKVVLVGEPAHGDHHLSARYFTPWACHPSYAVSGAVCTAAAAALPDGVVGDVVNHADGLWDRVIIEHPAGTITSALEASFDDGGFKVLSGGCIRTARKLMDGHLFIPQDIWNGHQ